MCATAECRSCRKELRELDKKMGSVRTYISARPPGREANEDNRKIPGISLLSNRTSVMSMGQAPVTLEREERRPKLTRAERTRLLREARKEDRTLIDDRWVSNECPGHGTYNSYLNWYCRCIPCSHAYVVYSRTGQTSI